MSDKFIPNGDVDFQTMADLFARTIARDPGRSAVSPEDSDALTQAVERYCQKLQKVRHGGSRSRNSTREKNEARAEAERIIRRLANLIRVNDAVDAQAKFLLNLRARAARPKAKTCPQEPPRLWFVRARHEANAPLPLHELKFRSIDRSRAKPEGAVRLELFVDLVAPDEPIPAHPGANLHSRPWYLRSYTRSPIVLAPPMTSMPMRVVYWGRWADSTGNVGPFSQTVMAWVEGGSHHVALPHLGDGPQPTVVELVEQRPALEPADPPLDPPLARPLDRPMECTVMLLEAQRRSYDMHLVPILEGKGEDDEADETSGGFGGSGSSGGGGDVKLLTTHSGGGDSV